MTTSTDLPHSGELAILGQVANRQAVLSTTANSLKSRLDITRQACFALSIVGATMAAVASGLTGEEYRTYLIWPATGMLALSTFLSSRLLGQNSVAMHVKARLASESLKREAYLYATRSEAYRDTNGRERCLFEKLTEIDAYVGALARSERNATSRGGCPREFLDLNQYISERIEKQIKYYRKSADKMNRVSRMLHGLEFALAASAAIVTAVAAVSDKGGFDVAALTAVVTTLTGIVMTHLHASRYDGQTSTYRVTANRLEAYKATINSTVAVSNIAERVEEILANETQSWQTIWLDKP